MKMNGTNFLSLEDEHGYVILVLDFLFTMKRWGDLESALSSLSKYISIKVILETLSNHHAFYL